MAKKGLRNVSVATFIGTSDPLTNKQLADLRRRFGQAAIDVLRIDKSHESMEIFPVCFDPDRQAKGKKTSKA